MRGLSSGAIELKKELRNNWILKWDVQKEDFTDNNYYGEW